MDVKWAEKAAISDEECVDYAPALERLMATEEWGLLLELMKFARTQGREAALEDDEKRILYWKGFVEGLKVVEEFPRSVVARARQLADREETKVLRVGPSLMRGSEDTSF